MSIPGQVFLLPSLIHETVFPLPRAAWSLWCMVECRQRHTRPSFFDTFEVHAEKGTAVCSPGAARACSLYVTSCYKKLSDLMSVFSTPLPTAMVTLSGSRGKAQLNLSTSYFFPPGCVYEQKLGVIEWDRCTEKKATEVRSTVVEEGLRM